MTRLRAKVRRWAEETTLNTTKLNYSSVGGSVKRNGEGGRKSIIDQQTEYMIYKSMELECINGKIFTFEDLRELMADFLLSTAKCRVDDEPETDRNALLPHIVVSDHIVKQFKRKWNIVGFLS